MKYNLTDRGNMKNVLPVLRSKDINTVKVLTELWEDVKPELPLSIGLRRIVEEEMKEAALAARGRTAKLMLSTSAIVSYKNTKADYYKKLLNYVICQSSNVIPCFVI